jgi:hypothetical protein
MSITGIYGLPGCGKSLLMLQHGLRIAEKHHCKLVTNFVLDPSHLAYYCKINNLKWLWENIPKGIVYYVSANKNFAQFLQISNAVILLDEMGLYAPSAQFWTLPPEAYNAIANNRKRAQHIVYTAQYPSQVHSSIHQVCSNILYAEGISVWDDKLKNDRLVFKDVHLFGSSEFDIWFRDPKVRKNPIKAFVLGTKHWKGLINALDGLTFRMYDSFGLIEEQDGQFKVQPFGYKPFIIDPVGFMEIAADEIESEGYNFSDIEHRLDSYYENERKTKKKIYEANKKTGFVAWKICGDIPFSGMHPFQNWLLKLWKILPATSYSGLVKLDLKLTSEYRTWNTFDDKTKEDYKNLAKVSLGVIFTLLLLIFVNIFLGGNTVFVLLSVMAAFYAPSIIVK